MIREVAALAMLGCGLLERIARSADVRAGGWKLVNWTILH